MPAPTRQSNRETDLEKKKKLVQRLVNLRSNLKQESEFLEQSAKHKREEILSIESIPFTNPLVTFGMAKVPIYRDGESLTSHASPALIKLVDLYLEVAHKKSHQIVMLWPAVPRTLLVIHALATLERWARGDKRGIRGLIFPAKTNVFHPLNHLHFDRLEILRHARELIESSDNTTSHITRKLREKDAYLFSIKSIKFDSDEQFNPTIGELLPHFYAGVGFKKWESCAEHLLEHVNARLARRLQKKALKENCDIIGNPRTAPDALFALDGRMSKEELRLALVALKREGTPEVLLINATRPIRQGSRGWTSQLSHFCRQVEDVFCDDRPGILVVTDEPYSAFSLKKQLTELKKKKISDTRWQGSEEYWITAICNGNQEDGLLPPGLERIDSPVPREFRVEIVDTEANRVINRLFSIANRIPGGREKAQPVIDAATYLSRLAALPCGVQTLVDWLCGAGISDHARRIYSWSTYHSALTNFLQNVDNGEESGSIKECLRLGSTLYDNYQKATPFALRLAELLGHSAERKRRHTVLVFTNTIYRRLAEKFLSEYTDYLSGIPFRQFEDRVLFFSSSQLEEHLSHLNGAQLIFAGLDEDGLRLLMLDNRIAKHTIVLLTQRAGQYLRAVLNPLVEKFEEFRQLKPRIESILRQLNTLPENQSILSMGDFVLPTFRPELSAGISEAHEMEDPEAWKIVLDNNLVLYHRPTHHVFVYDPANEHSTDKGFRGCEVQTIHEGDKIFVMSAELRELVETILKDAGIPIEHDKTFEAALRDYQQTITKRLSLLFPSKNLSEQVRLLRNKILLDNVNLAKEFPAEQSVRYWINLGESADTPFEQLKPQAPRKEAHFLAFAQALGISNLETAYYWQRVIMPVRNARRLDGRHVSDLYAYMLLQPESAMLHSNIKRQTLNLLFTKARENVATVESITPPCEEIKS